MKIVKLSVANDIRDEACL